MKILENVDLAQYSTMRLGGTARYLTEIYSREDVEDAVAWAVAHNIPPLMIGGGSNIFWRDEGFEGLVLINKISGYQDRTEDDTNHFITLGAGENWDNAVKRTVESGLSGIEALSLIPGTAGATPIQNVGAYGQEIADTLVSVEVYDLHSRSFVTIPADDCNFGYRSSRFKTTDRGRYFICSINLHLTQTTPTQPFYRAVSDYFAAHNITIFTPQIVRDAVIDIRSHKLPDPAITANNGSFFANPVIDQTLLEQLQSTYPYMPHWPASDTDNKPAAKIPAAWLIEQAGFKDYHDTGPDGTGMATWASQPLVLVNESAKSTADLLKFKQMIVDAVQTKFDITLIQEPELLP